MEYTWFNALSLQRDKKRDSGKKNNTISIESLGAINSRKFLTSSPKESWTNSNFVVAFIYC